MCEEISSKGTNQTHKTTILQSPRNPLIRLALLPWTSGLITGVVSLEGYNIHVVVFYYLSLLEIWPDEGMVCGGKDLIKGRIL